MSEKATEQRKDLGLVIRGLCNGFRQYTRKNTGEIITQLLIMVPGAANSLQVELSGSTDKSQYVIMEPVTMKIVPTFYDGKLIGFAQA
ncbi:MAG: hypothetical protein LBD10_14115 [Desulfobulbus sp.]|jgi:hypothetical protein|uniref:hypothetical protein n=1 Tax=Desulfobulbus sp. TaxID=895 RepID=UPI0028502A8D|nr:hypothetical protein [Desulfobulbus sp.]MDR2551326.1 hypothetical protein [Desulfobulbus sp.]